MKFVRRKTNMVTYILARVVCSCVSPRIFYSYPSCIKYCLINDNS